MNARERRAAKRHPIGVEKGFGPRHAFNAQEGGVVPGELPTPPGVPETRGDRVRKWLINEVRSGVLSDEAIEEIRRNPASLASLGAYATAAIALSSGKGARGEPIYPPLSVEKGAIPGHIWASWKSVTPPDAPGAEIRVDPAGNYFQETGSHHSSNPLRPPEEQTYHVIVQPVEAPGSLEAIAEKYPEIKEGPYKGQKPFNPAESEEINAYNQGLQPEKPVGEDKSSFSAEDVPPKEGSAETASAIHDIFKGAKPPWLEDLPKFDPSKPYSELHLQSIKGTPAEAEWNALTPEEQAAHLKWLDELYPVKGKPPSEEPPPDLSDPDAPPEDFNPPGFRRGPENPPMRYRKGKSSIHSIGVRHNPKPVGRPRRVGVAKGFGPRHGENAKEGEDLTAHSTDTVPAMLTPREAVLNRNAAELAGRGEIEALNEEGNQLAREGVDLAGKDKGMKKKLTNSKQKPSGSPYAQGFERMQGGGNVDPYGLTKPEPLPQTPPGPPTVPPGYFPPPLSDPPPGATSRQVPTQRPPGTPPARPDLNQSPFGGPSQVPPGRDPAAWAQYMGARRGPPQSVPPSTDPFAQSLSLLNQAPPSGNVPPGPFPPTVPPGQFPLPTKFPPPAPGPSQSFYPRGMGLGFQGGSSEVYGGGPRPIGSSNEQTVFSKDPFQLTAGDLSKWLQTEGKKQGLDAGQIAGLTKAFQGLQQGYGAASGTSYGEGSSVSQALGPAMEAAWGGGGYQGGISDIGYPPFVAPGAEFHGDKGGWIGQYDPNYMFPHYRGGTGDVPGYAGGASTTATGGQEGGWEWSEPGILPGNWGRDIERGDLPHGLGWQSMYGGLLGASQNAPGWSLGGSHTQIPTTWSYQGPTFGWVPQAVPQGDVTQSTARHAGQKKPT